MIMKKYIFLIVTVVCLFACKDGDEVRQTTSPEASFSIDKEEYTVGDIVYLTDESVKTEGEIVEYFWHFGFEGEGNRATTKDASVLYKKAGAYVIKLTVTDEFGGYATASHTVVIRPTNMPPVTDFSYSPAICKVNEKVQFTDKSVDEDGEIVSYEWDFGNGQTSQEKDPEITFTTTGFVTVKLTATDDRGATNTKQATLYVRDTSISGVTVLWDKTFEVSSSLRSISPAVGDNGDVYVSSNALHLFAYSPSGEQKWMFDLSKDGGAGNQGSSPMVGADGTIYMGASTTDKNISSSLYAIHPDGTQKWRYELGIGTNIPYISPALSRDGNILIGNRGTDGSVHMVDRSSGRQFWRRKSPNGGANGGISVGQNGVIYSALSGANGFARTTQDGVNLSPNLGKGNTAAAVYPAIDAQGNVYVAFSEGVVAAYDNQGNELWRYPASGTMGKIDQGGPAIGADGTIYVGTKNPNAQVVALTKGGAKKWSYSSVAEIGTTPAIDSDGNIHICDDGGNYIILNADGTEKYKRQLGSKIWSSPVIADYGIVYVTYEDNGACKLIAIDCGIEGPANSPWAQRGQNAKRNALQK